MIPYAFLRAFEGKEAFLEREGRLPKQQMEFLMQGNMKGKYLGLCLDSCRWGSSTTVMYETDAKGMIEFITNWMDQNKDNLEKLWHERRIDELYKKFELPHKIYASCPRDPRHRRTIKDKAGRIRCAHISRKEIKPSFFNSYVHYDDLSATNSIEYFENEPLFGAEDFLFEEDESLNKGYNEKHKKYLEDVELFKNEEPTIIQDHCYAIMDDSSLTLSLEEIIKRLNIAPEYEVKYCEGVICQRRDELNEYEKKISSNISCIGHRDPSNKLEFNFDGWTLAYYVQKWHEQPEARLYPK